jgi:hypothetical protein
LVTAGPAVNRRFGNIDALNIYGRLQVISSDFFTVEACKSGEYESGNK